MEVTVEDEPKRTVQLNGMPLLPMAGDTVALQTDEHTAYGVVRHRHFEFTGPDVCRVSLVCMQENR